MIDRRGFLALGAAGCAFGQAPPAVMPPPPKAKITSSVMLWTLRGAFEDRVRDAAESGMQSVELVGEYAAWDDSAITKARRLIQSFGMTTDTIIATPDWAKRPVSMVDPAQRENFLADVRRAIPVAKKLECPQIILISGNEIAGRTREEQHASLLEGTKQAGELAAAADLTLIVEPLNNKVDHKGFYLTTCTEGLLLIKEVDNPHVRLLFDIYHEQVQTGAVLPVLKEAVDYTVVFHVADAPGRSDPGTGQIPYREIYQAIQKSGYTRYVAMEYRPKGAVVASLEKAVDEFRAAVNERGDPARPMDLSSEGSRV